MLYGMKERGIKGDKIDCYDSSSSIQMELEICL